jgi:hypothetical protein
MKRLFLTSIAALLLATGAAHADELSEYGNARNMLPYCKELLDKNHPINHPKHGYCMATISVVVAYLKRSNDCPDFPKEVTLADAIKIVVDSVENFMEKGLEQEILVSGLLQKQP